MKGNGLIALGFVLILAAAALTGYNLLEARQAQQTSIALVQTLKEQITPVQAESADTPVENPVETPLHDKFPLMEMPVVTIDEQGYVGMLQIPSLSLELPVTADWSYAALKESPCRYQGSAYTGDLIVMAHNYDSHFGKLKELRPEDVVTFTDTAGNTFTYRVVELETLPGTAVEDMAAGEWDLTLFTCTYSGRSRVTIRCELQ